MRKIIPYRYDRIQLEDVNQLAVENYFRLIQQAEDFYEKQLDQLVDAMGEKRGLQLICLAGPSSSGKTTTAHKLQRHFHSRGRECRVISLDDFYLNTEDTPLDENGKPDFETVEALDIQAINICFSELLEKGSSLLPVFDFHSHRRREEGQLLHCGPETVLIMEGLHALNPRLTALEDEARITRVFVSARSKFMDGEEELISPKDLRLMRRMVRDVATRNTDPQTTIHTWQQVCQGEKKYIDPWRDSAAFKIDSTMDYEPCIFRRYLEPFMFKAMEMEPETRQVLVELWNKLIGFHEIVDSSPIPKDSVIREFIGPDQQVINTKKQ